MYRIDKNTVRATVRKRPADSDKSSVGSLIALCGCYGMAGAAIMSAKSALRSGIGLLKLCVPESIYPIMASAVPEAVFIPYKNINDISFSEKSRYCGAVLAGCGLGLSEDAGRAVRTLLEQSEIPLILDADAINIIANEPELLKQAHTAVTLTPHEREFSRLSGKSVEHIRSNREELALGFAREYGVNVVLKGHKTVCASADGELWYNDLAGNPGMAVGGSGDVLAGIIASLTAQGFDPFMSACSGVYIHAVAGDIAAERFGEISMLPTDIIDCLPEVFARVL